MRIEVVRGSVIDQPVEALVNAANTAMQGGGGIDGAIHRAAGKSLWSELRTVAPHGAKVSQVVVTGGHALPHRWILHVAGPFWSGGERGERDALQACYANALKKADELGATSIGFPSISTGIYRFPLEVAAPIALGAALQHEGQALQSVVFALFGEAEFETFSAAWEKCKVVRSKQR
jgi:O-acetyl-ADP-ribose deacetylase (regulator of RNase III)